jgi:hypothetical protein
MDTIMTINNKFLSILAMTLLLSACGSSSTNKEADKVAKVDEAMTEVTKNNTKQEAIEIVAKPISAEKLVEHKVKDEFSSWQRGRVQFLNLEGGFYGIITDSGKKILPMNMVKEFAQHGAIVRIKGKVKNVMTIQQWGTPFTITEIELIKPGIIGNPADM